MKKFAKTPWWTSIGFRRPEAVQDTDYADMGTAFGLDASLSPNEQARGVSEPDDPSMSPSDRSFTPRR